MMQQANEAVFARGFLLSDQPRDAILRHLENARYAERLARWDHVRIGAYTLLCDRRLHTMVASLPDLEVAVLGLAVNPFLGRNDNALIASDLLLALHRSEDAFFDCVDQLTGTFALVFRHGDRVGVLQDATGAKAVYYHLPAEGGVSVSSHERILAELHALEPDPWAATARSDARYAADPVRYLPGTVSYHQDVFPLTANCLFDLSDRGTRRFFPRSPSPKRAFDPSLAGVASHILARQAGLIDQLGRTIRMSVANTLEGSVVASSFEDAAKADIRFFSLQPGGSPASFPPEDGEAVAVDVYDPKTYPTEGFSDAFRAHSPTTAWPSAALCYLSEFGPEDIHVSAWSAEIGRPAHRDQAGTPTVEALAAAYTPSAFNADPKVHEALADFIGRAHFREDALQGHDWRDLFLWEHRLSRYRSVLISEAEMACAMFLPFNNRVLIQLFLSLPAKERTDARLYRAVSEELASGLAKVAA